MEIAFALRDHDSMDSKDRRHHARFPLLLKASARAFPPYGGRGTPARSVCGELQNIGRGGLGLICNEALPLGGVVECCIFLPGMPVPIPTLLSVRWGRKRRSDGMHCIGLQFLV